MATIQYRSLRKVFDGGSVAVDDLDLEITDGEFLVLVGPSGSGKTTVLRITAGLEEATRGEVMIGGSVVNGVPPMDRNIAMVFQNYALYPHMNVYANMAFGLKRHKVPKRVIKPRVEAAAQMLGIEDLLERKPAQLSGGQRQRVAMGRAIVREPDAFLMDEPLSNLDAKLRVEMRAYLAALHQRLGTTTLYVTHDQTEAMTMGDRVALMRDGTLQQIDRPQTLYDRPVNVFVAGFVGSPAMNLVRSPLLSGAGGLSVRLGGKELRLPETLLARRPGLRAYAGKTVIVGVRPEDIEDAAFVSSANGSSLDVRVSLAEPMGAEVIAYFPVAAEPVAATASVVAARGDEQVDTAQLLQKVRGRESDEVIVTARLNTRTRAGAGQPLRVVVDVDRLHFFDPTTEEAIW
ncbi:MAG: ABC transporter ATP-binding protein [Gaiellaceae bacterium]|jgi:multiple sugar transport system ATP-binding protein